MLSPVPLATAPDLTHVRMLRAARNSTALCLPSPLAAHARALLAPILPPTARAHSTRPSHVHPPRSPPSSYTARLPRAITSPLFRIATRAAVSRRH